MIGILSNGCEQAWRNGLLDPTQVGRFEPGAKKREIRRTLGLLIDEPESGPGTTEPTSEDLALQVEETKIGPGDLLDVSILDLLQENVEYRQSLPVNEVGYINVPELGLLKVADKSASQARLDIMATLQESGQLLNPQVAIILAQSQRKRYTIVGNVSRPGPYSIPNNPNFRLTDAIGDAGGIPPQIKTIFVIRTIQQTVPAATPMPESDATTHDVEPSSGPANGERMFHLMAAGPRESREPPPASEPNGETPVIEPLLPPPSTATQTHTDDLERALQPVTEPSAPYIYDNKLKAWVPVPTAKPAAPAPPSGARPAMAARTTTRTTGPFDSGPAPSPIDWDALGGAETLTRVIEVPVEPLMAGDRRYNIVIRPNDLINVSYGSVGEFYVMGNVIRPGAFQLTGKEITIREAIAASGGFSPLAMPSKAELIRRGRGDEEEIRSIDLDAIFAGLADNFYIKPNDVINVGTNPLMPFLATIRNAFRVSYGFGFVYDRNFADIDSFAGQQNPTDRRRSERLQRGFPP